MDTTRVIKAVKKLENLTRSMQRNLPSEASDVDVEHDESGIALPRSRRAALLVGLRVVQEVQTIHVDRFLNILKFVIDKQRYPLT